jgi:hypothetical protein
MKNNTKTTATSKLKTGLLTSWNIEPIFCENFRYKLYYLIRYWLYTFEDIPINYLIQKYLHNFWKKKKKQLLLKYRFLIKNILIKHKKKYIGKQFGLRKKFVHNIYYFRKFKFWRPKHVVFNQLGVITINWFKTGLHINIPLFSFPGKSRVALRKFYKYSFSKKKKIFLKKSKLQFLRIFLMKIILERLLQKIYKFPIICNFRHLMIMPKKLVRLRSTQGTIIEQFFFFAKDQLFRKSVGVFTFGFYYGQSNIIAQQFAIRLTRTRTHWRTLKQLQQLLHNLRLILPETSGFQIDIYGKIGAKTRTKFFRITSGKLPKVQTLAMRVNYTFQECRSFTGIFGIHVWLCTTI